MQRQHHLLRGVEKSVSQSVCMHRRILRCWSAAYTTADSAVSYFKPHSARTGRTVRWQLSAAVVRHKSNDGVVCAAIRAWFKYDTALSAVV